MIMIFWVMAFYVSPCWVGGGEPVLLGGDLPPPSDETSNDNIGDATLTTPAAHMQRACNTCNTRDTCITNTITHTTLAQLIKRLY